MTVIPISQIRERMRNIHPRTRKAQLNTLLGVLVKGGGLLISLLLVPLTIDYLSKDKYGTWLTISSVVTMITLFDIGIGNGLRNKLAEAVSRQDNVLARTYVSTAYLIFGAMQLTFICLFLLVFRYVPWQRVLNSTIDNEELQTVVLLTAVAIAIKLVLDILSYVLFAIQESGRAGLLNLTFSVLTLIGTYALTKLTNGNLTYLALVTTLSPIIVLLISSLVLYQTRLRVYRPALRLAHPKYARSLLSLGYKFFMIQIAVIVLFYTDNLIISQLFGPAEVTVYNVAFRYFNAVTTLFSIIITPYWSAFTEASVKKDTDWMKRTYSYLQKIWLLFFVGVIGMIIISEFVYSVWIGDRVTVPFSVSLVLGIGVIITCWNNTTVAVINGLGKVKLQLFCSIIAALINVPMAVYFGQTLNFGSAGVVLATCLSLLPATVTGTIQAKKLINGNAHGIWDS
ncbi:O-antigen export protein [Spirosoma flavus]